MVATLESWPGNRCFLIAELVRQLNEYGGRPWKDLRQGKPIDDRWLARQLSPYGIHPRMMRINGAQARGYCKEDILDVVRPLRAEAGGAEAD